MTWKARSPSTPRCSTSNWPSAGDHLGVEVESSEQVAHATDRLAALGLLTAVENDTTCYYAVQDKVWGHGPGQEPWEVYVVKADSATFATDEFSTVAECCTQFQQLPS